MAAALARALRGGRAGACTQSGALLQAIGGRMPREGGVAPLLPRLGAPSAPAAAAPMARRLLHSVPPPSALEKLRKQYVYIPGPQRFVPCDSKFAVMYLAEWIEEIDRELKWLQPFVMYVAAFGLVFSAVVIAILVHLSQQQKANQKSLTELQAGLRQAKSDNDRLSELCEIEEHSP
ncbi:hypothetical protein ACP4OV_022814 [Aristida adscensionis]